MPEIAAFKGVRYNPLRISSISRVVAPPYDVVDAQMERELLDRDEHNAIRLTLAQTPPGGREPAAYRQAARTLRRWRSEGVLIQDEEPSLYVVEQGFAVGGRRCRRLGFIAALLLEDFAQGRVRPHERTMAAPRADQLRLYEACGASLSQVLLVYSDPAGEADRLAASLRAGEPLHEFQNDAVEYRVWRTADPAAIARLAALVRPQPLFIADGHHRYESALELRRRRSGGGPPGAAPEDYISAFCISAADPGLRILPTHRGVKAGRVPPRAEMEARLRGTFSVRRLGSAAPEDAAEAFAAAAPSESAIGCYLPDGALWLLEPSGGAAGERLRARMPAEADSWWHTAVSLLHYVVLPDVCDIRPGSPEESQLVEFGREAAALCRGVRDGRFGTAFLLPATRPQTVEQVASRGQRMPMKSTYFYPKIASGLVFYVHEPGPNCPHPPAPPQP